MSLELRRLIRKVPQMELKLLAGENGMGSMVSWIHMVESTEASTFLTGGEIVFTTGIGTGPRSPLLNLVRAIWEHNASGLIINLGPYVPEVPQEVIAFGNGHDFPIFSVPWEIHIAQIMRIFCFAITKTDQAQFEIAAGFKNSIFFPQQQELYMVPLSQRGFDSDWSYHVCVMQFHFGEDETSEKDHLTSMADNLGNAMRHHHYRDFAVFCYEEKIITVLGNYSEEELHDFITEEMRYARLFMDKSWKLLIGIGRSTKSIRCISKSYHQAVSICRLHAKGKADPSMIYYTDMGIYKLLIGIEDPEILKEYYSNTIRPLADYDKEQNSDLCRVLSCYLRHDGSVKETADELFVHRNTVNYKLKKIESLLSMKLSSLDARLQLSVGFMLQDMF